jgi:S-adenosylmethionine:tRNA ribosyltransferase-isomerase
MSKIPEDYRLDGYDYELPPERVADHPVQDRDQSKLLVLNRRNGEITDSNFRRLSCYLPKDSLLVKNVSKVFPARLQGVKEGTGGKVEFLLLTPLPLVEPERGADGWNRACVQGLVKPARGLTPGQSLVIGDRMRLTIQERHEFGQVRAVISWSGDLGGLVGRLGSMPLPPYIKRQADQEDLVRYQTVYADEDKNGSVAAPTAGLHFTPEVMDALAEKSIQMADVTLYVGYGTFSPIRVQDIRDHRMHPEYIELGGGAAAAIRRAKQEGRPVVAVGTTTVRALESIARQRGSIQAFQGWSDLYILPGFEFRVIDHLITNFHLPRSSLMVMVSALCGREKLLEAYAHALAGEYRFFSYGDAMLIL